MATPAQPPYSVGTNPPHDTTPLRNLKIVSSGPEHENGEAWAKWEFGDEEFIDRAIQVAMAVPTIRLPLDLLLEWALLLYSATTTLSLTLYHLVFFQSSPRTRQCLPNLPPRNGDIRREPRQSHVCFARAS